MTNVIKVKAHTHHKRITMSRFAVSKLKCFAVGSFV